MRCHLCSVSPGWPLPERPVQCPGYICWCYQLMSRTHAGPGPCPWEWQRTGEEQKKRNVMKQNEKRWRKTYGADVHTGKKGTDVSVTKTDDCIDKSGTSWRPLPTCLIFVPVRSAEPLPVGSHHQRATSCQEAKLALKPQSALQQRPHGPSDFS